MGIAKKDKGRIRGRRPGCNRAASAGQLSDPLEEAPAEMRPPAWPFEKGQVVELVVPDHNGARRKRKYKGRVISVTADMLVVDVGKYRVSVTRRDWWIGCATIKVLAG